MTDTKRAEAAHLRVGTCIEVLTHRPRNNSNGPSAVSLKTGIILFRKISPEEGDECMKNELCLRCRQKEHLAKDRRKQKRD